MKNRIGQELLNNLIMKKVHTTKISVIVLCAFITEYFFVATNFSLWESGVTFSAFLISFQRISIIRLTVILLIFTVATYFFQKNMLANILYRYRYIIAGLVLLFCVVFEISGSSIGCYEKYLPNGSENSGVLWGQPRIIRFDEWQQNTPMAFSQYFNQTGKYPYFSNTIRGTETDTFIVFGQPVWDIAVLFRPFHWGYLFLGASKGLSFFWCGRFIALIMVTFEFFMIITYRKKLLAIAGALLIALSPVVQWWFAINGFVEMLFFGQLALLLIYHYMVNKHYLPRLCFILLLVLCAGAYILTFYPAWQIPMFYVLFALAIGIFWENKKDFCFNIKKDGFLIALFFILLGISMLYVFSKSSETILATVNTAYPGKRISTGGGIFNKLFQYPGNIFFPFTDKNIDANVCEQAVFFDFFPLGLILAGGALFVKNRKKDYLSICVIVVTLFLGYYCAFGFPEWLSKISLFSYCASGRAQIAFSCANIFLLLRTLSLVSFEFTTKQIYAITAVVSFATIGFVSIWYKDYNNTFMLIFEMGIVIIGCIAVLIAWNKKRYGVFTLFCSIVLLFCGVPVNPIQKGIDVIYENVLTQKIFSICHENPGVWITDNVGTELFNLSIMAGAPTINSINVYPNFELWSKVDPAGIYKEVYNRHAHIGISLVNDQATSFELKGPTAFMVYLNIEDLKTLGIRFIISTRDMNFSFDQEGLRFKELARIEDSYTISEVIY